MSRCYILPTARTDLQQVHDYIAEHSPANALRFVQRLEDRCFLLAENPYIGIARLDLGRIAVVSSCLVLATLSSTNR